LNKNKADARDSMMLIVRQHLAEYPAMEAQDIVKLLYQSCFGPRHLHQTPNRDQVMRYLASEVKDVDAKRRFVEDIGNGYVRVYLDAVRNGYLIMDDLADMFLQSMRADVDVEQAKQKFLRAVDDVTAMIRTKIISFEDATWTTFVEEYLDGGIRAVHHSRTYKERYHPHYRVVLEKYLKLEVTP